MNPFMYLFIRDDLSHCQQIIQTAHAAAQIGEKYHGETYACLMSAKNEDHLLDISEYLHSKGIDHAMFFEPDINAHTAIATRPLVGDERAPLKRFEMMKDKFSI